MRRLIPPNTKIPATIIRGITVKDVLVTLVFLVLIVVLLISNIYIIIKIMFSVIVFLLWLFCVTRYGRGSERKTGYSWLNTFRKYIITRKKYTDEHIENIIPHYIENNVIEIVSSDEFAAVIHLIDINLLLHSTDKQENTINELNNLIKTFHKAAFCKTEMPINFDDYVKQYIALRDEINAEFQTAKEQRILTDMEMKAYETRLNVVENWIGIYDNINKGNSDSMAIKGIEQFLIVYEKNKKELEEFIQGIMPSLEQIGLRPKRLTDGELSEFLTYYTYGKSGVFEYPQITEKAQSLFINGEEFEYACICEYPYFVDTNCWASTLFSIPNTSLIYRFEMINDQDAKVAINKAIKEFRYRFIDEKEASGKSELTNKHDALNLLLNQLDVGNERLVNCSLFIKYKKTDIIKVRDVFRKEGFTLSRLICRQFEAFVSAHPLYAGKISSLEKMSRLIQTGTFSASFPFANVKYMDKDGDYIGDCNYPVMWNLWNIGGDGGKRTNANLFVHGTAGSGKSRTLKQKIMYEVTRGRNAYIFDVENEYMKTAQNFNGAVIDMSGGETIINPFQIFTLDDENETVKTKTSNLISMQITFLSEWFKNLLKPDAETSSVLSTLISIMYERKGLAKVDDLGKVKATDFPTFDDLLNIIKQEIDETVKSKRVEFSIDMLRKIQNLIRPFAKDGMYAPLWNGTTSLDITSNKLVIFNFQTIFAEANTEICNAQMMLVMRLVMQTIIKLREYNLLHKESMKHSIVLVDEAHRFVDRRFEIALDTLEQFARRLRKYGASLWIATQSIGDFLGSTQELKSKAEAIIDNCTYQIILGQKGTAIENTIDIYKRGNPLTQAEVNFVTDAQRGQGILVFSQGNRTPIQVNVLENELQYVE